MGLGNLDKIKKVAKNAKGGGIDLFLSCQECGKPIIVTNKYGMFCKDLCGLKEAKLYFRDMQKFINEFIKTKK